MTSTRSRRTNPARTRLAWLTLAGVGLAIGLSGCGGGSNDNASSGSGGSVAQNGAVAYQADSIASGAGGGGAGAALDPTAKGPEAAAADVEVTSRALIKTGAISLESSDIAGVIAKIDEYAAGTGGLITSEDTQSNTHGTEVSTRLVVSVPETTFERAYDKIAGFGDLIHRTRSTQDVTSRVVDVDSRVISAKDSIAQLRSLFQRATKLGQIIALERELSDREANLEALQAEQHSLAASTTMSTITVNATRPAATAASHDSSDHAGFIAGLKQGWHGMIVFVVGFAHGLGLILPLGIIAVLVAGIGYLGVRRFTPRHEPHTSE